MTTIGTEEIVFEHLTYAELQEVIERFYRYLAKNKPVLAELTLDTDGVVLYTVFVIENPTSLDKLKIETIKRSFESER